MLSKPLARHAFGQEKVFRWRGEEPSRFEGVSDAVFAFSVTLLVVSLEVPKSFDELMSVMRGFLAFSVSFVMLAWVWFLHYRFFRRYGLQDGVTLALGAALLFVVLFYVYPLKFLFGVLVDMLLGQAVVGTTTIEVNQLPLLMVIYGLGFAAVFLIFALLHLHAQRHARDLDLNEAELRQTRGAVASSFVNVGVALLSVVVALIGPNFAALAGLTYFLLWPLQVLSARRHRHAPTRDLN